MRGDELLARAKVVAPMRAGDADYGRLELDSRRVTPGTLFVCMPSASVDTHSFLDAAKASGAVGALVHSGPGFRRAQELGLATIFLTPEAFPAALWRLASALYERPTRTIQVFGITGTNGKTTTAWLLRDLLTALGRRSAYLGTLGFDIPGEHFELANTTPFAVELMNLMVTAREKGVDSLAIELSSHALAERRADGIEVDVGVFTNLSQDHLDYHGTMADYEAAKWRLFSELPQLSDKSVASAINVDDAVGARWAGQLANPVTYGRSEADVVVRPLRVAVDHLELEFVIAGTPYAPVRVPLGGDFNVSNSVAAVAALVAGGLRPEEVVPALANVRPVPGRFEAVPNEAGVGIVVDYAHTPDALEKLLDTVRSLSTGRVITVFGCGGDRDRTKRPLMARAASTRSDLTVVTSDNPRTEDPDAILAEVMAGIANGAEARAVLDREEAVRTAVRSAQPGDVVVIAGKGHEHYQILGRTKVPMDDRKLALAALEGDR